MRADTVQAAEKCAKDVQLAGSPDHIRGYFFKCFPKLPETEMGRRPTESAVHSALQEVGPETPQTITVRETRTHYQSFKA